MCPVRLPARRSKWIMCRAIIPIAGGCWRSPQRALSGSASRSASTSASAAAAPFSTGRATAIAPGNATSLWRPCGRPIDCEVAPLIDAHGAGRRRITVHARLGTHDILKVGFAAAGSHDIVPIDRCPILDPALSGALEAAWALAEPLIENWQAARHPGHRNQGRPRYRRARLRTAASGGGDHAVGHISATSSRAADAPWRTGVDAQRPRDHHR